MQPLQWNTVFLHTFHRTSLFTRLNCNLSLINVGSKYKSTSLDRRKTDKTAVRFIRREEVANIDNCLTSPRLKERTDKSRIEKVKWKFLEHKGPLFAPLYEQLPKHIKFIYDSKEMELSQPAEEVATLYARMLNSEYTSKSTFTENFFQDWRSVMTNEEKSIITNFSKCNFQNIHAYFIELSEQYKKLTQEEKTRVRERNELLAEEYRYCLIDGHREKILNFKIEPPGLFRGRGEHPKMGKLKRRIIAEDIIINCSKDSNIPKPPLGHEWGEIRHDPTVSWLAAYNDNILNKMKYVMLNPCSNLRSQMDLQKYEISRKLHKHIDKIRKQYQREWRSRDMLKRQRAVALYFIDRLALRAGHEKDDDELDTVGCCSLRIEHITLCASENDTNFLVVFDFLGKDAIRYYNEVLVDKNVFENLKSFMKNKKPNDFLFDLLNTYYLNKFLNKTVKGLTAKVFRTYNASYTFQKQLNELTQSSDTTDQKLLSYSRANRAVAILCNHQRTIPKSHRNQLENLERKINEKEKEKVEVENGLKNIKSLTGDAKGDVKYTRQLNKLERLGEQLSKLETQKINKVENKSLALGTSKLNYIDPRITVAWCKKYDVPIEKIYSKSEREKFRWAIEETDPGYQF